MWADKANGLYEMFGGFVVLLHCLRLYEDKKVRGVSITATIFFLSWGVWNLYYYPSLSQWYSFMGGCGIVAANALWIVMMIYYRRKEHKR